MFAVNSMSVEAVLCRQRACFMLCLCVIKNSSLDPLAYGWVMFRNMQFGLSSAVSTKGDVTDLSRNKGEAVNVISKQFFDLCNEHNLNSLCGLWFLALANQAANNVILFIHEH